MTRFDETTALAALGHPGRLAVFRLLARRAPGGVRPAEIAGALGFRQNTLSGHLAALQQAGLVTSRRDGRALLYALDPARVGTLVRFLAEDCCRGRPEVCLPLEAYIRPPAHEDTMNDAKFNVLFLCSRNSARSIFAEAILRDEGSDKFRAFSAGTQPGEEIHPQTIDVLREAGHKVDGLRAKDVGEFQGPDAPPLDFVFTVCDRAANEECPPWEGQPTTAHWGQPDPVKAEGNRAEKALAFRTAYRTMKHRLTGFMALPIESLDRMSLQKHLDALGKADLNVEQGAP